MIPDPQPTPSVLDHAREAVRLAAAYTAPGSGLVQWNDLCRHAFEHYAAIAAALIEAHERRAAELEAAYREGFEDAFWTADSDHAIEKQLARAWRDSATRASLGPPAPTPPMIPNAERPRP